MTKALAKIEPPSQRDIEHAKLPAAYKAAVAALEKCQRIDECKTWADKAAALASYGRQSDDKRLLDHSKRIQGRAVRRAGQLLEAYKLKSSPGRPKKNGVPRDTNSQSDVARKHGISKKREVIAKRAAAIPQADFDAAIESDNPPTIKQLSDMGKKIASLPPAPEGFREATHFVGALQRLCEKCEANSPAFIAGGLLKIEIAETLAKTRVTLAWLFDFERELKGRAP